MKTWIGIFLGLLIFLSPTTIFASGHITTWSEETDSPPSGEYFHANNEPTKFCDPGFYAMGPDDLGGLRTCMIATWPCDKFWLSIDIVSYATEAEAQAVWNTFISKRSMQDLFTYHSDYVMVSESNRLLIKGGKYLDHNQNCDNCYGYLDLFAVYRGCLIKIGRTRISSGIETPPLGVAQSCWQEAYTYIKALIDRKRGLTGTPPTITLEPSTYPEFQINILEEKGFTIKIRDEDGVKDSQGNWKLNLTTLAFTTDGIDNSMNFIDTAANQGIISASVDEKEVRINIKPDPKLFMLRQNVFNILQNGEHTIGLQICDTDGHCGKSEYTLYFGPFVLVGSVTDLRCTQGKEQLDLGRIVLGNMGHASPLTSLYMALINADNPDEYWCIAEAKAGDGWEDFFWFEGAMVSFVDGISLPEAAFITAEHLPLNLHFSVAKGQNKIERFPAGNYRFVALLMDYTSGADKWDIKDVKTCSLP